MTRTRCLFVLPSLRGGGAERVTTILLRHLDPELFDLHLAVVQKTGPHVADVPDHVTLHDLGGARTLYALPALVRSIRRLRPDVVFSTISHMNLAVALTRPAWPRGTRLVLRETALTDRLIHTARLPACDDIFTALCIGVPT